MKRANFHFKKLNFKLKRFDFKKINFKKIKILPASLIIVCIILIAGLTYIREAHFKNLKKTNTISIEKSINKAKEEANAGKKDEAIADYENILKKDPNNQEVKGNLAMLYYQTKKYDKAEAIWSSSLESSPNNNFNLNSLANSYRDQGKTDEAIKYYLKAINGGNLDSVGNLVTLYNSESKYADSIALLNSIIEKNPKDKDLKKLLASTYSKKGDTEKANEILAE